MCTNMAVSIKLRNFAHVMKTLLYITTSLLHARIIIIYTDIAKLFMNQYHPRVAATNLFMHDGARVQLLLAKV